MQISANARYIVFLMFAVALSGCNPGTGPATNPATTTTTSTGSGGTTSTGSGGTTSTGSGGTSTPFSGGTGYLYLNQASPAVDASATLLVSASGSGSLTPVAAARGAAPSLDATGNLYTVSWETTTGTIDEYPASNLTGKPVRTLHFGTGSTVNQIVDAVASATGEVYVSDGTGVAVFNATANGNPTPDRYITGSIASASGAKHVMPGMITVDSSDNLYVANSSDGTSIAMFGPADNGLVTPSRVIGGPLTQMNPGYVSGLATDAMGDLYVLCSCQVSSGIYHFMVLEFAPEANGNVAPTRVLYADKEDPYAQVGDGNGMALGSDGTLYIASGDIAPSSVYVFAPGASNNDQPARIITSTSWADVGWSAASARIAVR